ncbi:MAG TPA: polysaccharide deacetylase family protein [Vicinamibacterales bacterium]|nr:polysaccharide deacetylase family protein [Vicinamibacterales bacterium]
MHRVPNGTPLTERGGRLRGVFDLVSGHYPRFLFGLPPGRALPVFHFHETTVAELEPAFAYLRDNGYHTVTSDAVEAVVRRGVRPGPRAVMLAFDDALASFWLVVGPLLRAYGLSAVTYAIPGRVAEASTVRPTIDDGPVDPDADRAANPFATWPELAALASAGVADVQSHTWSHSQIFAGDRVVDAVGPDYAGCEHFLNRPRLDDSGPLRFLDVSATGHPLLARRSRMSDARRFHPDPVALADIRTAITREGPAFFARPDWRATLATRFPSPLPGRWETAEAQTAAITHELVHAREVLEARLGTPVRQVCLPWGIAGRQTRARVEALGFTTAFANRLRGRLAVSAGDDPYFLKRLHSRYLFSLPGTGRRVFAFTGR